MSQEQEGQAKAGRRCSRENMVMLGAVVFCVLFAVATGLAIVLTSPAIPDRNSVVADGASCDVTQCIGVTLAVNNSIQEPTFAFSTSLTRVPKSSLFSLMERATDQDGRFTFSVQYFGKSLGYMLVSVNGLKSDYAADQTYWMLTNSTGHPLSVGISSYVPQDGETIRFIFTKYSNSSHT